MKRLHFFLGKGGVGKTTVASAFAVCSALRENKKRVLLISTDPAHSLADVLQTRLRDQPRKIRLPGPGHLDAWQINSQMLFGNFLEKYRSGILDLIDKGSLFSLEDIAPLLDTSLPGMAEMAALIAIRDAITSTKYSRIVVDTAPFGHTLRLFSLPGQFERFLNFLELAASRDRVLAAHFGGKPSAVGSDLLTHFRGVVKDIQKAITSEAEILLVTTAEQFSLQESVRCTTALEAQSPPIEIASIVLNRVVPAKSRCATCNRSHELTEKAHKFLQKHFSAIPIHVGADPGGPILGSAALAAFGEHVFAGKRLKYALRPPRSAPLRLKRTPWPIVDGRLAFVLGKGGVGKTTISAALALQTRHRSRAVVEICSVDPAPSLEDVFKSHIGPTSQPVFGDSRFRASELDAIALFRSWISILQSNVEHATSSEVSGIHLDLSFERQLLSALLEIVPPGIDEVLAIFRIFDLVATDSKLVIDMAPTGHALELLRMPERILVWCRLLLKTLAAHRTLAFARDAAAKIAEMSVRTRELAALLKDSASAEMDVVMLPEPLPDRETERLIAQLNAGKLSVRRIFLNRVLMDSGNRCLRCSRAQQWQQATLVSLEKRYRGIELLVVRNFPNQVAGKSALHSFTGELWRLA